MLTIGTNIRRLNHLEYPAFEKMNQNGRMIRTAMISTKGNLSMEYLLQIVCFSHLTDNYSKKSCMSCLQAYGLHVRFGSLAVV